MDVVLQLRRCSIGHLHHYPLGLVGVGGLPPVGVALVPAIGLDGNGIPLLVAAPAVLIWIRMVVILKSE